MANELVAVYFTDSKGDRFRVHDTHFGPPLAAPFKRRRLALCDPRAKSRVFVSEKPTETALREHTFTPGEDRSITLNRLVTQFSSAKFFPKHYKPSARELQLGPYPLRPPRKNLGQ